MLVRELNIYFAIARKYKLYKLIKLTSSSYDLSSLIVFVLASQVGQSLVARQWLTLHFTLQYYYIFESFDPMARAI